jgi:VanZ family protein
MEPPPPTSNPPVTRRLRWIWPLAMAALVVFASSRSHISGPNINNFDKVVHFSVFGLLATLICRTGLGWRSAVWALVLASAFGATDEWHQSFVPGRSCDVFDWLADTLGAAVAVTGYTGWRSYRSLLEWPLWSRPAGRA